MLKKEIMSKCVLQPYDIHRFILLEDFIYKDITVPKGYVTDGASIPRIFWVIYPPNRPDYLPAAIIHDYLCDKKEFDKADILFKQCLNDLNINNFTVKTFHLAVNIYHLVRYKMPKILKGNKMGCKSKKPPKK